ncbi:MAG: DUF3572 domain-containing protein [Hyphomicrobiaceae bacterium]
MKNNRFDVDRDEAEQIAISALTFLAGSATHLERFFSATGIGLNQLKTTAAAPETLASVLEFLLQDDSLLLMFTSQAHVSPDRIAPAHNILTNVSFD